MHTCRLASHRWGCCHIGVWTLVLCVILVIYFRKSSSLLWATCREYARIVLPSVSLSCGCPQTFLVPPVCQFITAPLIPWCWSPDMRHVADQGRQCIAGCLGMCPHIKQSQQTLHRSCPVLPAALHICVPCMVRTVDPQCAVLIRAFIMCCVPLHYCTAIALCLD